MTSWAAPFICAACRLSCLASVRLRHLDSWLRSWLPLSVFSASGGRGSVDAWYSTALDIEEVLSGLNESHVHVFVADVV